MTRKGKPAQRVVGYLRDSDELCSRTSIEDQKPVVEGYAARIGGEIMKFYIDEDVSGQTLGGRKDYVRMLADAEKGMFDVVFAEAVDRLGRRVADVTDLRDMLAYHGVELHVADFGLVTPLVAATAGMVAEMFSRNLADKTKRGQRGATSRGKVANGMAYGYKKCSTSPSSGRAIVPEKAAIINRIYTDFDNGIPPRTIAYALNNEGVPGPRGGFWRESTIRGDEARRAGILRHSLYNGELVFGRARYYKRPRTGKKRWQLADEPLTVQPVPERRIVPEDLWDRVQKRHADIRRRFAGDRPVGAALGRQHRRLYLLSGLIKCEECGGTYTVSSRNHFTCNRGRKARPEVCSSSGYIPIKLIDERVLRALSRGLASQEVVDCFVEQARTTFTARQATACADLDALRAQLSSIEGKIRNLVDQVEAGFGDSVRDRIKVRESQRADLLL